MSSSDSKTGNTLTLELLENILKTDNGGIQPSTNSSALDGLAFGEQVYEAIRAGISADDKTTLSQIKNLKREIIVRSICEDRTTDPFLQIAAVLHDACLKPGIRAGATDWDNVIRIVLSNKDRLSVYQQPTESLMLSESRNIAIANSAKRLTSAGYQTETRDGQVQLTDQSQADLAKAIELLCRELGGLPIVDTVLRSIQESYDSQLGRYHLGRKVRTTPSAPVPQIPWPYLLQLGVKNYRIMPDANASNEKFKELLSLVTDGLCLYDVQPYSAFETMLNTEHTIAAFLQKCAYYDSAFVLNQVRTSDAQKLYRGIFNLAELKNLTVSGLSLETVMAICDAIFQVVRPTAISTFTAESLSKKIGLPESTAKVVLDDVLAHEAPAPNENLLFPPLSTDVDFGFRPVLSLPDQQYGLLPTSITGPAFYEALASFARRANRRADDVIGECAEEFVKAELTAHGVEYKSGTYQLPKAATCKIEQGECDVVIETQETILLLELKKKALTRAARSGSDIKLFIDLSLSVIDAQLQAMRHEAALREFGQLQLRRRDGQEDILNWDNRSIERIALTVLDFGSLQDRVTLHEFLLICCRGDFYSNDPTFAKDFAELREKQEELRRLAKLIGEFDQTIKKRPFFSCWFLSVPQLLLLLENVSSGEDLKKALWQLRSVTFRSQDFYQEYAYRNEIARTPTVI